MTYIARDVTVAVVNRLQTNDKTDIIRFIRICSWFHLNLEPSFNVRSRPSAFCWPWCQRWDTGFSGFSNSSAYICSVLITIITYENTLLCFLVQFSLLLARNMNITCCTSNSQMLYSWLLTKPQFKRWLLVNRRDSRSVQDIGCSIYHLSPQHFRKSIMSI